MHQQPLTPTPTRRAPNRRSASPAPPPPPALLRMLYSCRINCTSFSEHWVSVTVELKEMPPPFLGWRREEAPLTEGQLQLCPTPHAGSLAPSSRPGDR